MNTEGSNGRKAAVEKQQDPTLHLPSSYFRASVAESLCSVSMCLAPPHLTPEILHLLTPRRLLTLTLASAGPGLSSVLKHQVQEVCVCYAPPYLLLPTP